ncbi:MAG: molybdopterin molybdotransferase MoeA [Betaproteobacteria bacterium]|nr:molybdopterin molybdotransferase MoeA [Betaproteobacteria bacterium]
MTRPRNLQEATRGDDYDPNSMPVAKARELIRGFLHPIEGFETLPVRMSLGRILAEDIVSPFDVPGHDNSAMDGYALRHAGLSPEGETILQRAGESFAGRPFGGVVGPGQCVRIFTGAVMPEGTDTVVMQEQVVADAAGIHVGPGTRAGQNRRRAGDDIKSGARVFAAGQLIRPAELGMLASLGLVEVRVKRRLRVACFSTGDELRAVGAPLGPGEIHDSNRYTLFGMLTRLGCEVLDLGAIADRPELLEHALASASQNADVVITSGGVSVGDADYVKTVLDRLGEVLFWKIAMKPGRPLAYGRVGHAHFFGLPGNPVAVMVSFYEFVREALLLLMGQHPVAALPTFRVPCSTPIKKAPGRTEFQRGILEPAADGSWSVRVTGDQSSGILSSMSLANCFIVLSTEQGNVAPGALVEVKLLEGLI